VIGINPQFTRSDIWDRVEHQKWGKIENIIVQSPSTNNKDGYPLCRAIIHFQYWYTDDESAKHLSDLQRGRFLKVFYNTTAFWKTFNYDPSRNSSRPVAAIVTPHKFVPLPALAILKPSRWGPKLNIAATVTDHVAEEEPARVILTPTRWGPKLNIAATVTDHVAEEEPAFSPHTPEDPPPVILGGVLSGWEYNSGVSTTEDIIVQDKTRDLMYIPAREGEFFRKRRVIVHKTAPNILRKNVMPALSANV